jgi:cell division protein ZapE
MDSQRFILDSFTKLTNGNSPKNLILNINSHELICPITALDCAVFSFNQLCRAPMGSSDYIAICEKFNVIILSEIPELSKEEHNEAKRFIHLIDTIYEFKKILICTAKVDIDSIYQAGKWHFEFLRTASRLHEMQSKEYLELM